jgi:hypothetical protein
MNSAITTEEGSYVAFLRLVEHGKAVFGIMYSSKVQAYGTTSTADREQSRHSSIGIDWSRGYDCWC